MSDPIGTAGTSSADTEFSVAFKGGGDFMSRLNAMIRVRDEQLAAFEKLKLGTDAQSALNEANSLKAEAVKLRDSAGSVLADAKAQAAALLDDAQKRRDQLLAEATAQAKKTTDAAVAVKADADAYAKTGSDAVAAALADAAKSKAGAEKATADAQTAKDRHLSAKAAADKATADTVAAKTALDGHVAKLRAVLRDIG